MFHRAGLELAREVQLIARLARADAIDPAEAALRNPEPARGDVGRGHGLITVDHLADVGGRHGLRIRGVGHVDEPAIGFVLRERVEAAKRLAADFPEIFVERDRGLVNLSVVVAIGLVGLICPRHRQEERLAHEPRVRNGRAVGCRA
jgi:hypothetical protein